MVTLWLLAVPFVASAQDGSVKGRVTDASTGEALPGANVYLVEIKKGASSDIDGNYAINSVPAGSYTIVASYIGYKQFKATVEVSSGEVEFNVSIAPDPLGLDELVVTAQGVQREKRALGYAVTTVKSDAVANKGEADVVRSLNGKIPGVEILQTSGVAGTGTNFQIRGFNTITQNTQPLFIVDGVQFNINTNDGGNFLDGSVLTSSSRFLDIDPNNIADISVLKGIAATTIYGELGRNGVVLITTKGGQTKNTGIDGFDVNITQSYFQSDIASLPDYQDNYGIGFQQNFGYFFSNWGPAFRPDSSEFYGGIRSAPQFRSVGDDGWINLTHPYLANAAQRAAFPEFENTDYEYRPYDNVGKFFRTGVNTNTSINVSGVASGVGINLSVSADDNDGFVPGNNVAKNNIGLGLNFDVTPKLSVRTTVNAAFTDFQTPPISAGTGSGTAGDGLSVFADVFYTPRAIDLMGMPFENPANGVSAYYRAGNDIQNPRWTAANSAVLEKTDRYFGKTEAQYKFNKDLSLSYKIGLDTYTSRKEYRVNSGNIQTPQIAGGLLQTSVIQNTIIDQSSLLQYNKLVTKDISINALVGFQYVTNNYNQDGAESQNQLTRDLFRHSNFTTPSTSNFFTGGNFQGTSERRNLGFFGDFSVGYGDYVYVNFAGRQDYFSTLEPEFNNLFYPSFSVSFIPTEMLKINSGLVSYLKVRAGIGQSAGAPNPYNTRNVLAVDARNFVTGTGGVITTNAVSNFLGNPSLKPERVSENEIGIESRFFNDKLGLDVTLFDRKTTDMIVQAQLDPSTGYTSTQINIGEVQTTGLEVAYNLTPIQQGKFKWNIGGNFYTYESKVNELSEGITEIAIAGYTNEGNFAITGQPLGIMKGSIFARDAATGQKLVDETGNYYASDEIGVIGNPIPKYTTSMTNTFSWNGLNLSIQFNYQRGGDVLSYTIAGLLARGITSDTDFDRQRTIVLPGIREATGQPNDIQVSATEAFFTSVGFGPSEASVFDATHIRLQEVNLSYDIPARMLKGLPLKGASLGISGTNLWYFAFNVPEGTNFDPQVSGTGVGIGRGIDYFASPTVRRFGGVLRLKL